MKEWCHHSRGKGHAGAWGLVEQRLTRRTSRIWRLYRRVERRRSKVNRSEGCTGEMPGRGNL